MHETRQKFNSVSLDVIPKMKSVNQDFLKRNFIQGIFRHYFNTKNDLPMDSHISYGNIVLII